ncbi:hypothetical protein EAG_14796 [Camponotus floridanus]|uniref:Uncharacterized protein n=1 Tax=Camponotus floridanus TaxID=104421 RepID=E1ZWQ1_CAMFO|nr:hypothetical protein EAG_14796 [Camponotus floridanus]
MQIIDVYSPFHGVRAAMAHKIVNNFAHGTGTPVQD